MSSSSQQRILLSMHRFGQSYMHLPSLLARTGFPVDAVVTRGHPLRGSRALSEVDEVDELDWARAVDRRLASGRYGFLCNVDEPGLLALYRHSWTEVGAARLPFPPGSTVAGTIGSKRAFYAWCEERGLPIPRTFVCRTREEVESLRPTLAGDWMIKGDRGTGGRQVVRWREPSRNPLPLSWDGIMPTPGSVLVQEDVGTAVGGAIFLAIEGRLIGWFGIRKRVCLNGGLGPTVRGEGDQDPALGALCVSVAAASGVTGFTGFDYVTTPDRGPVLIDSHLGRATTMVHFDRLYGVDFAAILAAHLRGDSVGLAHPRPGPAFIKFPEVLELACKEGWEPFARAVSGSARMPLAPPGDLALSIKVAAGVLAGSLRVMLGGWRRRLAGVAARG